MKPYNKIASTHIEKSNTTKQSIFSLTKWKAQYNKTYMDGDFKETTRLLVHKTLLAMAT